MDYFYVYVIRSIVFERNYVGFTKDVESRLMEHNSGKTQSTRPYIPWKLVFFEKFSAKVEAIKREKFLKSGQGRDYVKHKLLAS